VHADGNIDARLWDIKLEPITEKAGAKVEALVKMGGAATQTVALKWDAPSAAFQARPLSAARSRRSISSSG